MIPQYTTAIPQAAKGRRGRRRSVARRLALALSPAAVALAFGLLLYASLEWERESNDWVRHTHQVLELVHRATARLVDAETGQRGFLLTGDERYLQPYEAARGRFESDLAALRNLTRDNPQQQRALDTLATVARAKFAELAVTIALRRAAGPGAALGAVNTDRGERLMEEARRLAEGMRDREEDLLAARAARQARTARVVQGIVVVGTILSAALAVLLYGRLARQATALEDQNVRLEGQTIELEAQTLRLQDQAMELEAANDELRAAGERAEAANVAKGQFLAAMSHELRTPLNAIMGYVDLLDVGLAGPLTEHQRGYLERTRVASRHLLTLVTDILDLSKIEAGRASVHRGAHRAADAVEAAVGLVQPQAEVKGVGLVNGCRSAAVAYWGDEGRVHQILVNLLANAVKFTGPGGQVTVTCSTTDQGPAGTASREAPHPALARGLTRETAGSGAPDDSASDDRVPGDKVPLADAPASDVPAHPAGSGPAEPWAVIRVEDTGVGIPPDQLDRIFEPFTQAQSGLTRPHGGTGLGLTISRRLARLMGGDVSARSAVGRGSSFFLHLPAASVTATARDTRADRRGASRYARGLGVVGDAAMAEIERILSGYITRLRADPETPSARALTDQQIEDHAATFLADVAQGLAIIETARGAPSELLRDGTVIQRVVATRHGVQRARLGWAEAEIQREFEILREEIGAAVRRRVASEGALPTAVAGGEAPVDEALAVLARFVDHAERASLQSYRLEADRV